MGFQKPDLTSSVHSEEKVSKEITEKEIEENKINKVDDTENVDVIASRSEVSTYINIFSYTILKVKASCDWRSIYLHAAQ